MSHLIRDLFQTQKPDGTYFWDASATGWALLAWVAVWISFLVLSFLHPPSSLQDFGIAAGAVLSGGGLGTLLHSKSTP